MPEQGRRRGRKTLARQVYYILEMNGTATLAQHPLLASMHVLTPAWFGLFDSYPWRA